MPVVRDQLRRGGTIDVAVLAVAAWARFAAGIDEDNGPILVVDDRLERLAPLLRSQHDDPLAILAVDEVFGDLADDERFRRAYAHAADLVDRLGARGAVAHLLAS